MSTIVLIGGYRQNGKDLCANYLVEHYDAERLAFADILKDEVALLTHVERKSFDIHKEQPLFTHPFVLKGKWSFHMIPMLITEMANKNGIKPQSNDKWNVSESDSVLLNEQGEQLYWTPRALCIFYGSTMRIINPNYWAEKLLPHINNAFAHGKKTIAISDFRYHSEVECLKQKLSCDIFTLRMNRTGPPSTDPSERDLDNFAFDYVIDNTDSTPSRAYKQIDCELGPIISTCVKKLKNSS